MLKEIKLYQAKHKPGAELHDMQLKRYQAVSPVILAKGQKSSLLGL